MGQLCFRNGSTLYSLYQSCVSASHGAPSLNLFRRLCSLSNMNQPPSLIVISSSPPKEPSYPLPKLAPTSVTPTQSSETKSVNDVLLPFRSSSPILPVVEDTTCYDNDHVRQTTSLEIEGVAVQKRGKVKKKSTEPVARSVAVKKRSHTKKKSDYFSARDTSETLPSPSIPPKERDDAPLNLELATPRRKSWTPPPENTIAADIPVEHSLSSISVSMDPEETASIGSGSASFQSLQQTYGFKSSVSSSTTIAKSTSEEIVRSNSADRSSLFKKRKIEIVSWTRPPLQITAPTPPPAPKPAIKKKLRTITELATSAYMSNDSDTSIDNGYSLQNLQASHTADPSQSTGPGLGSSSTTANANTHGEDGVFVVTALKMGKRALKKTSSVPKKPRKNSKAAKAAETPLEPPQLLLPPSEALDQANAQNFVFGTSSQLAAPEGAAAVGNTTTKVQTPKEVDHGVLSIDVDNLTGSTGLPSQHAILWKASSRNEKGRLMTLQSDPPPSEIEDDTDVVDNDDVVSLDKIVQLSQTNRAGALLESFNSSDSDSEFPSASKIVRNYGSQPPKFVSPKREDSLLENPVRDVVNDFQTLTKPILVCDDAESADIPPSTQLGVDVDEFSDTEETFPMPRPNFNVYSDSQLSQQVRSYGFKPVRERQSMISLLENCWTQKHGRSFTSQYKIPASSAGFSTSTALVAARRGRPRKNSKTEEIDSFQLPPSGQYRESLSPSPIPSPITASPSAKRRPGRPRKNSITNAPSTPKTASNTKSVTKSKGMIEITTSQSEILTSEDDMPAPKAGRSSSPRGERGWTEDPLDEESIDTDHTDSEATSYASGNDFPTTQAPASQLEKFKRLTREDIEYILPYITLAITTAPRSNDPQHPSWHEKMLLYDPIVAEDLAVWLNEGGQLSRVGCTKEVPAKVVKLWCDQRSVCCIWKQRSGFRDRKRL